MSLLTSEKILSQRYQHVRARSEKLCAPLAVEDHVPQPVVDVSPPKWHLGHTTWFFETFVLQPHHSAYVLFDPAYSYLFNSYYNAVGERVARPHRGHMSRPTVAQVQAYRAHVDQAMQELMRQPLATQLQSLIELGLQHEQQHQELLVTDIKVILGTNPLRPAYDSGPSGALDLSAEHDGTCPPLDDWLHVPGGVVAVGHTGPGFAFDNESPGHQVFVSAFEMRHALITNAEYEAFIADGAYDQPAFWLSDGWDWLQAQAVRAPMYWERDGAGGWVHYTLRGVQPLEKTAPVTHLSYYEADAFCRWAGWRLPTEFEWEIGASKLSWGRRWEWTQSAYAPYPGFKAGAGALGEYNGKFMVNQQVLRGASFATAPGHARLTYRNFFHAPLRWQYTGIRPVRDLASQERT